jgi:hypothetical protein
LKTIFLALLLSATQLSTYAAERERGDYNFDGHEDYRVYRESNGKQHYYDHFLYEPRTKKYVRSEALSALFNPQFDADTKEIRCIWPGGHSGKIFYREDYKWQGSRLALLRVIKQTDVEFGPGDFRYVRVTTTLKEGKPSIDSIEHIP